MASGVCITTFRRWLKGEFKVQSSIPAQDAELRVAWSTTVISAAQITAATHMLTPFWTEATFAGYTRKRATNPALNIVGAHLWFDFDNYTLEDVGAKPPPLDTVKAVIVYVHNSSTADNANWPLFITDQVAGLLTWTPDGRDIAVTLPPNGLTFGNFTPG